MGILLVAAEDRIRIAAFSEATGSKLPSPWRAVGLPGSSKPFTRFDLVPLDGNTVLRVLADHSYANLVHDLPDVVVTRGTAAALALAARFRRCPTPTCAGARPTTRPSRSACCSTRPPRTSAPWNKACSAWRGRSAAKNCPRPRSAMSGTTPCPWEPS
jgi:hypothetical protein